MYNSFAFQYNDQLTKDNSELIQLKKSLFDANMAFFSRVLPELKDLLDNCKSKNYSLFVNTAGELNILDNASGEALYAVSPKLEVSREVTSFLKKPVPVARDLTTHETMNSIDGLPDGSVVLVFGVGCGYHLRQLLLSNKLSALLIYEADVELFKHSLNFIVWQDLLELANQKNVLLAIQPNYEVTNIKQHLVELDAAGLFRKQIYIYRHTFNGLMEEVIRYLLSSSGDAKALLQGEGRFLGLDKGKDYLPVRTAGILGNITPNFQIPTKNQEKFNNNFEVLKNFYPEVASFYEDYKPYRWLFCLDHTDNENIYNIPSKTFAYRDSKQDSESLARLFMQDPFQDSAVYSQSYQEKLGKYIHFQQIAKVELLQKQLPKASAFVKKNIRTLAFFGTGLAHHIELTVLEVNPLNIFVFEEDPDLFYASLYTTDWAGIIEQVNSLEGHLYFNIGCNADNYLNHFLHQLYIVGAHEISNTFIFPCYYRPHLQKAIGDLRRQLKTFIALNEYYDNARYSLTHFIKNAENNSLFYQASMSQKKKYSCPVFIVGNGPSLDELIEYIRLHQSKAIIISCGTALKALFEYGITPDFHAEVEQNGATYNWINQVPNKQFLKSIKLLSTSAVHPETAKLFDTACLAFTQGQTPFKLLDYTNNDFSSTTLQLKFAFPTVSNFAIDISLNLGFQEIYLLGVDLGFTDIEHHHSKMSAYYTKSGANIYNYADVIGQTLSVAGNFLASVGTKFEFNMARRVMEQAIDECKSFSNVYNCSNGALIKGAVPLYIQNVLIEEQSEDKINVLNDLILENFSLVPEYVITNLKNYIEASMPKANKFISKLIESIPDVVENKAHAMTIKAAQTKLLRAEFSNDNLLSYHLLEGTIYSFLGLISSFADVLSDDSDFQLLNELKDIWQDYLVLVKSDLAMLLNEPCPIANLIVQEGD